MYGRQLGAAVGFQSLVLTLETPKFVIPFF